MAWKQYLHNCEDSLKFSPSISLDVFRQYFFGPLEFFCHPCVSSCVSLCFVAGLHFADMPSLVYHDWLQGAWQHAEVKGSKGKGPNHVLLGCSIGCYVNSTTGPQDLVYIDLQILHCDAASWREPSNYKPFWAFQAIDKKVHQATLHRNGKFLFPRRYSILKPSNTR